jgi:hypothetical protein
MNLLCRVAGECVASVMGYARANSSSVSAPVVSRALSRSCDSSSACWSIGATDVGVVMIDSPRFRSHRQSLSRGMVVENPHFSKARRRDQKLRTVWLTTATASSRHSRTCVRHLLTAGRTTSTHLVG